KWADAEIVVYVGCGERGNEMTDVLQEFPELEDPKSGQPLMLRTVLVANTSNMPVAAREASVYTGITMGEYFRDMGYSVALMADSTSRWAEAMREMSGRLEEMPGEEGYPAYLGTRIADFYERAGKVLCIGGDDRQGALSVVGAVSPAGGDLSDPVVQATLRVVKVFWSLKAELAYQRHFPAIDWLDSYSLYTDNLQEYYQEEEGEQWIADRDHAIALLQEESNLQEIAKLVGAESLSPEDQLVLETSKSLREDFLHQNAFHEVDTYTSMDKQRRMLAVIMRVHEKMSEAVRREVPPKRLFEIPVREEIARMRYTPEDSLEEIDALVEKAGKQIEQLASAGDSESRGVAG
ncbi:MAG: V-type ATP synthase subunit A, partial [Candidatus Fermentibacteraceae bacterium]